MKPIYDFLPTYHQVEANNLKGLQPGFVVAQMEIAESAKAVLEIKNRIHHKIPNIGNKSFSAWLS